jgi:CRISPR/Cas system CSM-associated protein Csm3 (group 7 of RAMP superfamily)
VLRRLLNELTVHVEVESHSPLLIKDGRFDKERSPLKGSTIAPSGVFISRSPLKEVIAALQALPDRDPVRKLQYYVPGSSVRGSWRSHLEMVLRSLDPDHPKVCDPLLTKNEENPDPGPWEACSSVLVNKENSRPKMAYKGSCPVCRLFGSTAQASRISFSDGRITGQPNPEIVDNVAINRFTGAVKSPFKSLALLGAKFTLDLHVENFELWHVGLLAWLFEDLKAKRVPLGSGKNKGLGEISAIASRVDLAYYGATDLGAGGKLLGIGELLEPAADRTFYGLERTQNPPDVTLTPDPSAQLPWRHSRAAEGAAAVDAFWSAAKPAFGDRWSRLPALADRKARAGA